MGGYVLTQLDAVFARNSGDQTGLTACMGVGEGFDVVAQHRRTCENRFPQSDVTVRRGTCLQGDVERLVLGLLADCRGHWYHHYRSSLRNQPTSYDSWWTIRVAYTNGHVLRWEGVNGCPDEFGRAYDRLVSFGMPELRLNDWCSFEGSFRSWSTNEDVLRHLIAYPGLVGEALEGAWEERTETDLSLLCSELAEDVELGISEVEGGVPVAEILRLWGVRQVAGDLLKVDVSHANRNQMLALYHALVSLPDRDEVVCKAYRSGVLGRWTKRLEEIPGEERRALRDRQEEERRIRIIHIDRAIEELLASGEAFTSRDLAKKLGVSAQSVAQRIRRFTAEGKLEPVGDKVPRHYRATASSRGGDEAVLAARAG